MDIFLSSLAVGLLGALIGWAQGWDCGRRARDLEWWHCLTSQGVRFQACPRCPSHLRELNGPRTEAGPCFHPPRTATHPPDAITKARGG